MLSFAAEIQTYPTLQDCWSLTTTAKTGSNSRLGSAVWLRGSNLQFWQCGPASRSGSAALLCDSNWRLGQHSLASRSGFAVWQCGLAVWWALCPNSRLWQCGLASRSGFAILALRYRIRGSGSVVWLAECCQCLDLQLAHVEPGYTVSQGYS